MYTIEGVALKGVCAAVPRRTAKTADYDILTEEERRRFAKATGIEERRIVTDGQCASDLCFAAAEDLLHGVQWDRSTVGLLVLITQTGDYPVPATGIVLQDRLGLPQNCIAFDVNLGCSAFPFGLSIVGSMMKSLGIGRALLLIGDVSSKVCAYGDKSTWPLFGDAGSATALELDAEACAIHLNLQNDGAGRDAIIIRSGGPAARLPTASRTSEPAPDDIARAPHNLELAGADVFSFAIQQVPRAINATLEYAGVEADAVDFLVLHQANRMINETIRGKVGIEPHRTLTSLTKYGNTSSVSIPLTVALHGAQLKQGGRAVLCGFGVGLSWGTAVMEIPKDAYFSIQETDDANRD